MELRMMWILLSLSIVYVMCGKHIKYGSFGLVVTRVEVCNGPKHKSCTIYSAKVSSTVGIDIDVVVVESMAPVKGKVLAVSNSSEILRLQTNKPCENLFIKPILQNFFNMTDNCIIKKGHYKFNLDFEEILRRYYGGMHLYGLYEFRSVFYGKDCNFSCCNIEVKISENK